MRQSVLALLLGITAAVRIQDSNIDNTKKNDVGPVGYDPFVRRVVHENVSSQPEIPRSKHQILPDSVVKEAKKEAKKDEEKKAVGADAPKEGEAKADAPKEDAPKADAKKEEAPKKDEAKAEAPKADAPKEEAAKEGLV